MASPSPLDLTTLEIPQKIAQQLRFLDTENARKLFVLPSDLQRVKTEVNRLNNQILVRYYETEWKKWN